MPPGGRSLPTNFESNGRVIPCKRENYESDKSLRQFRPPQTLWVLVGDLIVLAERRANRSRHPGGGRTRFYFDLGCPFSYLAAERIERVLGEVQWVPAAGLQPRADTRTELAGFRAHAETCAVALRLPLVWPDRLPSAISGASRAAAYAAEIGAGARFALAASRLAFCGGFDLDDPETLAEAAAAAGIPLRACLAAAGDPSRDAQLLARAQGLTNRGVRRLPAIRAGRRIFHGDRLLAEAAAMLRSQATYVRPLAPAG